MSTDAKLAKVDERSSNNATMIVTIFSAIDNIKKKTWYIAGTLAGIFLIFSILAGVYASKQSYMLGKIDTIQESANSESKEIIQRLTKIETGIEHSTKANERAHKSIKSYIEKLEKKNTNMEFYTQGLVREKK